MTDTIIPHSLEAEKALLGAVLITPAVVGPLLEGLAPEDFYRDAHRRLWDVFRVLHTGGRQIDLVSIRAELDRSNDFDRVGGASYIASLTDGVPRSADADHYSRIVMEQSDRRRLQAICRDGITGAVEEASPSEFATGIVQQLSEAVRGHRGRSVTLAASLQELLVALDDPPRVCPTGLQTLDALGAGFRPGELSLLSGRPSAGKTALALAMARTVAMSGTKVWFASLEMRHVSLSMRLLAAESNVEFLKLRSSTQLTPTEHARLVDGVDRLSALPVELDDSPGMGLNDLRRMIVGKDGLLVVDYLQLLRPPVHTRAYGNRVQEVGAVSRGLKAIAHDCGVSVLALSQLSRAVEGRGRKAEPVLADLRDSGELEQDADVVMIIFPKGELSVLKVAKNRNGPTGRVLLDFDGSKQRFRECDALPPETDPVKRAAEEW